MSSTQTKKMGVIQLTIITAVNMMGSGIIMLPTNLAKVGTISILSWVVTAVCSLFLAYGFSRAGMFSKHGGGMGGYAEYTFGKEGSFMSNYTYAVSLVIANIAIAVTTVGYLKGFIQGFNPDFTLNAIQTTMLTILIIWLTTILNFGGASITGKIGSVTVWGVILPVVVVCVAGWFFFKGSDYVAAWNPHNENFVSAVGSSISITLWSFLGLESASANMDAVENPQKNVPIAVMGGTIATAIMYIISTNVIQGIVPNAQLAASDSPFGLAFAQMFTPAVGTIVEGLMVLACFGSLLGWQFTVAEVFRSSANEGYFPKIFKKVTKSGAPVVGMCILLAVQTLLALMTMSPDLNKQFTALVDLAVVTNMVPYILSMTSLKTIQAEEGISKKQAKTTNILALIGAAYAIYAIIASGVDSVFDGAIVIFVGWVIWGIIFYDKFDLKKGAQLKNVKA
ncbi:MAG: putrescine-ornithine antiporter [Spirochaetaceae bacterium]|jgi:putrescine:ornithine antiporter|nr:putrescine-ornithine antiporter [Spirochaetaceae bacterium]